MGITSLGFFPFLAVGVAAFYLASPARRWMVMLVFSLGFYLLIGAAGLPALLAAAFVAWYAALRMDAIRQQQEAQKLHQAEAEQRKKRWLIPALVLVVGALLLCKYWSAVAQDINSSFSTNLWTAQNLLVPLGISYYTLQLVGYLVDVYRGGVPAEKNPLRVACYALFFLSITQGPFNRYDRLMPQLEQETAFAWSRIWSGAQRMAWGYFQKLAVADRAAQVVNRVFDSYADYSPAQQVLCAVCFGVQIYADFAGYTNIVLGAGELFGLQLPDNFRQPYFADSVKDFWRRWHISLSTWFRDYLYIPLGGSRRGKLRTYLNVLITFTVSGLWHGVSWTFVIWGFLNGLFQVLEGMATSLCGKENNRRLGMGAGRMRRILKIVFNFILIDFAWIFFRADSLGQAVGFLSALARPGYGLGGLLSVFANRIDVLYLLWGILLLLAVDLLHETGHHLRQELTALHPVLKMAVYQIAFWSMALMGVFVQSGASGFLYARF